MGVPEKFLFEHDFDAEVEAAREAAAAPEPESSCTPEPPPPEPSYFEEDLARAREAGYREGHEAGRNAGQAEGRAAAETEAEQELAAALSRVSDGLDGLLKDLEATEGRRDREALDLSVTLVRKLFPALHRRNALGEAESLIETTLDRVRQQPQVVVRAASDIAGPLAPRLDDLAARGGYQGRLTLQTDESLAPGDVQVVWSDGGARRDTGRLWQDIDAAIARVLGPEAEESDPPADTQAGTQSQKDAALADGARADGAATPAAETGSAGDSETPTDADGSGRGVDTTPAGSAEGATRTRGPAARVATSNA